MKGRITRRAPLRRSFPTTLQTPMLRAALGPSNGDTGSSSSAGVFNLLILYPPSSAWSPDVTSCSASLRRCTVWVYLRATFNRTHHSHHCVAEMVATAASATVSNIVRMTNTEAGLSVQTAEIKVQWCVSPTNILPMSC